MRPRTFIFAGALLCFVTVGGCVDARVFQKGDGSETEFNAAKAYCKQQAGARLASIESQAERYDGGSDSQIIGAGLGIMLADASGTAAIYNQCMKRMGYKY